MNPTTFRIVPGTDKEYVDAFLKMASDGVFVFERVTLGNLGDFQKEGVNSDKGVQDILSEGLRVLHYFAFHFANQFSVRITRSNSQDTVLDEVSISAPNPLDVLMFTKLVASVQKYLGQKSFLNIGTFLGEATTKHFEAREIALARLERMSSTMLQEMEDARKARELEFVEKEKNLQEQFDAKQLEFETLSKKRQEELDQRGTELKELKDDLDDRAAKHARRQHYKDIKEKFEAWGKTFKVTDGTSKLRESVFWFTIALMVVFGALSSFFLFRSLSTQDTAAMVASIIKQIAFTAMFVSTAYFFIRWNNQWFQRHANEEFRLKRMELDIDRASWFVEMAFEWKDEKGEEIPVELIERLTHGLFADERGDRPIEPVDSLAQALIGAARFKVKLADGTEAEYDRKGIEKLIRSPS